MSQEQTRPSQFRITEMLAEVESRQKRATRHWLLLLLAPLAVGACLLVYTSYAVSKRLRQIGELDAQIAEKERIIAERNRELENKDQVIQAKTEVISEVYEQASDPGVRAKILNTIESNPKAAAATPRVFIHYQSDGQRPKANAIGRALRGLGYVVPDFDKVRQAPRNTEVRYFRPEDQGAADKVAGVVKGAGLPSVTPKLLNAKTPPGQLEVWLPAEAADGREVPPSDTERAESRGTVTVLRGDFRALEPALAYARSLSGRGLPYSVEVYRQRDGRFYVTLGGYASGAEAEARKAYAVRNRLGTGAYNSTHAVGENLFR